MIGLILKDLFTLTRQALMYIVFIAVFSLMPGYNMASFAVIMACMMPMTALAYDERSKWDQLAALMPYSTRDIVLGKYVFGWLCIGAAAVLSLLFQAVLALLGSRAFAPAMMAMAALGGLCILDISLPVMFRFGVEKGRMAMFLVIFLVCGTAGAIASIAASGDAAKFASQGAALVILLIAAVVLTAVSIPLSQRFYWKRMG